VGERADALSALSEVFREHGFEGASLALITASTGLGKGSLYHFFPGGKEEMAAAVLDNIDHWFETQVFEPLRADEPALAIHRMIQNVREYFRSGQRVCLVGAFALNDTREKFSAPIRTYFSRWIAALSSALIRSGVDADTAASRAEDAVLAIQGALVLTRALGDEAVFVRAMDRLARDLAQTVNGGESLKTRRPRRRSPKLSSG
jgi:TetR/AcrR family transcriptional repressor of lmrAB and yxaGH operons